MITGFASQESAIEALNLGATAYLEKPFADIGGIQKKIEDVIERQSARIRNTRFLEKFKERNVDFLRKYAGLRNELDHVLQDRDN